MTRNQARIGKGGLTMALNATATLWPQINTVVMVPPGVIALPELDA
jgi:hypothetical protein